MMASLVGACGGGGGGDDPPPPSGSILGIPDRDHGPSTPGDIDGDGIADDDDNCPSIANADQRDACGYRRPAEPSGGLIPEGLGRINYHRRNLGLNEVVEDPDQSEGCRLHVAYLIELSNEVGSPQLQHGEDPSKPYYTEQGAQAGGDSVLSLGTPDIAAAVDQWINSLYHRLPLIHPGLEEVGIYHDGSYGCVQYRSGTRGRAAPHPIPFPAADIQFADRQFFGAESPCPTVEDPLGGGACPPSATIATLGLHGHGVLTDVSGSISRIDTGEAVPLFKTYWDGGPTPHEQMGYLEGSIALIPEPSTALVRAPYQVEVNATVDGEPRTYRWRFHIQGGIPEDTECDFFGSQGTFEDAVPVTIADINGRICDEPDFFRIRDAGTYKVTLNFDPSYGWLQLHVYDAGQSLLESATERESTLSLDNVPGMGFIEIRGATAEDIGPYVLLIE